MVIHVSDPPDRQQPEFVTFDYDFYGKPYYDYNQMISITVIVVDKLNWKSRTPRSKRFRIQRAEPTEFKVIFFGDRTYIPLYVNW